MGVPAAREGRHDAVQGMAEGAAARRHAPAVLAAVEHHVTGPARFDPSAVELAETARLAAGPRRA
jgi:ribosomal protein S12 methylthiotransferase accessory factor